MFLSSLWAPTIDRGILTPLFYSLANLQVRLNHALALYFPRGSGFGRHPKLQPLIEKHHVQTREFH